MKAAVSLLFALCVSVASAGGAAASPVVISFVSSCPRAAVRACLVVPVAVLDRPTTRALWRKSRETEPLLVRGRIAGGEARVYRVTDIERWEPLTAAYFGRTADNRPIFLTDRGALEVEAPYLDVEELPGLVALDATRKKPIARYLAVSEGEYVVNDARDVAVWDVERKQCIVAPQRRPGLLTVAKDKCKAWVSLSAGLTLARRMTGNIEYAIDHGLPGPFEIGLSFDSHPVSWREVQQVRGLPVLIAQLQYDDECGTDEVLPVAFERLDRGLDWMRLRE